MRKITENAVCAFMTDRTYTNGNTAVLHRDSKGPREVPGVVMLLHGNAIMWRPRGITSEVWVSDGDYPLSATTKERITGLPGVSAWTKDYEHYIDSPYIRERGVSGGVHWEGGWIRVI
jgi:hypothetical protein